MVCGISSNYMSNFCVSFSRSLHIHVCVVLSDSVSSNPPL